MTIIVANTANTNTFDYWRNRTNELAYAMSTYAVTVGSNSAVGNATIIGTFIANSFQISNTSGTYDLTPVTSNTFTSGVTSNTVIDNFEITTYNTVEYLVSVKDNVNNNYFTSKILVTHDTVNPYMVEYGSITTNTDVGAFATYSNSTHILLNFTPVSSNATVKFARIAI